MDDLCVHRTMSLFDWIDLARSELKPCGVSGLEIYTGFLTSYEPDYLSKVKSALDAAGFEMPMFCASPDFTSPDPLHRQLEIDKERQMMGVSAALGGSTCRVLSGQRRPEVSREDGVKWVVECISALLGDAEQLGVILTMENHFKDNYWDYPEFAQKMDIFCEIVNKIDSPWYGVNYDPSNTLIANEDPIELLRRVAPRVVSMHASDRRLKPDVVLGPEGVWDYTQLIHGEIGTGLNNFDEIFSILRGVGFDGWVSIEDGINGMDELKRSAQFLANKMGL